MNALETRLREPAVEVVSAGQGMTFQDGGRRGLRGYGVPDGGFMDRYSAHCANRLVGNPDDAVVIEALFHGATLRAVAPVWIASAGAGGDGTDGWRAIRLGVGQEFRVVPADAGVWTYVAVEGGWVAPVYFGSVSWHASEAFGGRIQTGTILTRGGAEASKVEASVVGRSLIPAEVRHFGRPPVFRVWPGPQWTEFSAAAREALVTAAWAVSWRSDRVGYRLEGRPIASPSAELISEPVRVGSIQVPPDGTPIVTLRDGPTVGGYPKIGMVDPADLDWLVQCRPGSVVHFRWVTS